MIKVKRGQRVVVDRDGTTEAGRVVEPRIGWRGHVLVSLDPSATQASRIVVARRSELHAAPEGHDVPTPAPVHRAPSNLPGQYLSFTPGRLYVNEPENRVGEYAGSTVVMAYGGLQTLHLFRDVDDEHRFHTFTYLDRQQGRTWRPFVEDTILEPERPPARAVGAAAGAGAVGDAHRQGGLNPRDHFVDSIGRLKTALEAVQIVAGAYVEELDQAEDLTIEGRDLSDLLATNVVQFRVLLSSALDDLDGARRQTQAGLVQFGLSEGIDLDRLSAVLGVPASFLQELARE